jgi:AcrR family transcriptional regulator
MSAPQTPTRAYRSAVRSRAAQRTRVAVIEAAHDLFVEQGYGVTTIDAIAARAGVGRATVFKSVGGKPALMRAAHHAALVGGDDPRPPEVALADRWAAVAGARARLASYVLVVADVFEAVGPIHEALVRAASEGEELSEQLAELEVSRHEAASRTARLIAGELRPGLSIDRAADLLWAHNDPLLWQALHGRRGWSKPEFVAWLSDALCAQLLG